MEQHNKQHIEQEIAALEARLAEKRQALGVQTQEAPPEREMVKEAVRERMEQIVAPLHIAPPILPQATAPTSFLTPQQLLVVSSDKQLAVLVNVALEQGIDQSVHLAKTLNDPFIYDSLHDSLTTMFYDELVKRKKLEME